VNSVRCGNDPDPVRLVRLCRIAGSKGAWRNRKGSDVAVAVDERVDS
jgi:hypothetical protein